MSKHARDLQCKRPSNTSKAETGGRKGLSARISLFDVAGHSQRDSKTFTWLDQADTLTCPVAHLVALALHDEAFQQSSLNSADRLLSLTVPRGEEMLTVPWRDEILDKPILRTTSDARCGAELQGGAAAKRLKSLGEKMGYPETVTWYWLRRLVLNAVDGSS